MAHQSIGGEIDGGGHPGFLQRACACGGSGGLSGSCSECEKKKMLGQSLQTKLRINEPGDEYEQEADQVADQVMRMPEPGKENYRTQAAMTPLVQRRTTESGTGVMEAPQIVHDVLNYSGQPLDPATRAFFESRFGHDFGKVQVHSGTSAEQSARDVRAHAYTVGHNIVFGAGQFSPETNDGKRLLAHELAHVVQQTEGLSPAVQRVCEPAAIGTPGGCTLAPSVFSGGSIFRFKVECDDFSSGQEAALIAYVRAQPASATFKIHGYASIDGLAAFNQNLACARALKAQVSMITGGIAASRITDIVNHGPTPGPAIDRRGVAIEAITSASPAPRTGVIASQTVAVSPGGRTRTTIGVGEEVDLTFSLGSTTWATTAGTLIFIAGNPGPLVRFTAPDTAQFVTVTAGAASILFTVLAPTSVVMDRQPGTGVKHTVNRPNSGIQTRVFIGPDSVNFYNVRYRELDVAGVPTDPGAYSCNTFDAGHCGVGAGSPCTEKALSDTVVVGMGTQSVLGDCVYSGSCPEGPPFIPGSITLNIPYEYRVGTGPFSQITEVAQVHALAPDASTLTTSKAGANGTTTVASPTVKIPQCP